MPDIEHWLLECAGGGALALHAADVDLRFKVDRRIECYSFTGKSGAWPPHSKVKSKEYECR